MTRYDWVQVAKACLSGGDHLPWKAEYEELAKKQASIKRKPNDAPMTIEMLLGKGEYDTARSQMYLDKDVLAEGNSCAMFGSPCRSPLEKQQH